MALTNIEKRLTPLIDAINSGKKVTFFTGAGVSTNAGIPDFRSPDTGLYSNLAKLDLPFPEAVFDIGFFKQNPKPFYTLAEELYPGQYAPTKFHFFIKLLQEKDLLKRVYTQNIDTLERLAGVEDQYMVEAHGSFASNHCIKCHMEMDNETLREYMADKDRDGIPTCDLCQNYVKPDIVFFGEGLPDRFFEMWEEDCADVEVAIVAGTSLTVYPFGGLPSDIGKRALRVLINNENVGDFSSDPRESDIVLLGDCDEMAETICSLLGFKDELDALVEKEQAKYAVPETVEEKIDEIEERMKEEAALKEREEDKEVEELAKKLGETEIDESKKQGEEEEETTKKNQTKEASEATTQEVDSTEQGSDKKESQQNAVHPPEGDCPKYSESGKTCSLS
ncbi:HST2 [[Candida] subhashii]|uniref:NAD-dependent protein deacetylase n=1 Tax=[Candida] subhashii TaxID=561895 RepID=A0A8J5URS3_9ASCO|nr:HST2 [[Candida] subhashii]KAG7664877.1 HST2 [[Candida] subhashii]